MNTELTEKQIIDSLQIWRQDSGNLVVGIEGYSGAGKTTLLRHLSEKYDFIQPVFMDDFVSTANTKEHLMPQIENNISDLILEWAPVDGLEKLRNIIIEYKKSQNTDKVLIIEGIFLCHPHVINDLLDKRIYLDVDKNEADTRRVAREKERWGEKYFPETHPDSFARLFKIAYKKYVELYNPKEHADLVIIL
jgi:uridine kinase